jgi:hypothetical protein
MLHKQVERYHKEGWLNEHLQPSTWRFQAWDNNSAHPVALDYIGVLEMFDPEWGEVVDHFENVSAKDRGKLVPDVLPQANRRLLSGNAEEVSSKLSRDGIKFMCSSSLYKDEWGCLGYPNPCDDHEGGPK